MPKYAPTLVIGVRSEKSPLKDLLDSVRAWLSECYPQVTPIVRFGLADENRLQDRTEQVGEWVGEDLTDGLRICLEIISEVNALEKVRGKGVEVLGAEQIIRRVILLLDGATTEKQIQQVVNALGDAVQKIGARVNLLVALICHREPQSLIRTLKECMTSRRNDIIPVQIIVLNRYRSDGSVFAEEALPIVLRFLLLTALAPYETDEHWLFVRPMGFDEIPVRTVGVGLMHVPLPEIAEAAGNYLAFQLSQLALSEQPPQPQTQRWLDRLTNMFNEPDCYRALFEGIDEAIVTADINATSEQAFQVQLREGLVRLELSGIPWHRWKERLADFEALWSFFCEEFWLPQIRENAQKVQKRLDEGLKGVLNEVTSHGVGIFAAAEELLKELTEHLQKWRCQKVPRGVALLDAGIYQRLEEAIRNVPHPNAIIARFLLSAAVIAYTTFALARWSWLSGFIANWLQNFLPFIQPWMIPAFIGLMGFIALFRVGWNGWHAYWERVAEAEQICDEILQAIVIKVASILREAGLQALEGIQRGMLGRLKELSDLNREAKKALQGRLRPNWESNAKSYKPADTELTRAVVRDWTQLQGLVDERLKGANWQELWQQVLKRAQVTNFVDWCNWLIDGTMESKIAEAAETVWREGLQGEEMRRLSFYLKPYEQRESTVSELTKCYEQAQPFLWQNAREATNWLLLADGEEALHGLAREVVERRFGGIKDWQPIVLPAIIGFLRLGNVERGEAM